MWVKEKNDARASLSLGPSVDGVLVLQQKLLSHDEDCANCTPNVIAAAWRLKNHAIPISLSCRCLIGGGSSGSSLATRINHYRKGSLTEAMLVAG